MVEIDETDGSQRTIGFDFANDTADAVAIVRIVFAVESHTVVA